MAKKTYGRTAGGTPITDNLVDKLAAKAESRYDVENTLRRRGGRLQSAWPLRASSLCASTRVPRRTRPQSSARPRNHLVGDPQVPAQVPQALKLALSAAETLRRASRPIGSINASSSPSRTEAGTWGWHALASAS